MAGKLEVVQVTGDDPVARIMVINLVNTLTEP
jgi:hypothetical protein